MVRRASFFGRRASAAALIALAGIVGCNSSPAKGNVTGKVTLNNSPVTSGRITFHHENGKDAATALLNPDGAYSVTDVPTGEVKVTVESLPFAQFGNKSQVPRAGGSKMVDPTGKMTGADPLAGGGKFVPIPQKYQRPATTDLKYTVKRGDNEINIDLK